MLGLPLLPSKIQPVNLILPNGPTGFYHLGTCGGAWPFLVGGVICLVNSVNERDLNLLNSYM